MKVLQVTAHYPPNIGGVETHLEDLVKALIRRDYKISVLAYQPLTTKTSWKVFEKDKNKTILRIPWIPGLFYRLVAYPVLEFLYLLPGLFIATPLVMLTDSYDIIHAHGLVAATGAVFWGKIFGKRVVISTHSIYHFPEKGLYREFVTLIFRKADFVMGLSNQAEEEIRLLGIPAQKVGNFTYWIDLYRFKKNYNAKQTLKWSGQFVVLFVGRLIEEKGILELLKSVKNWDKRIRLKIIGSGPLQNQVVLNSSAIENLEFLGSISQEELPIYYSASDILIVPSISDEGFGRVILESLSCGTPVIGSNRGAIHEAMDETVGKLINIEPNNIKDTVEFFYTHKDCLKRLAKNCRRFAERRYSEKNVEKIIRAYKV